MPAQLEAKTVAITGGCSGIGLAVAKRCAIAGACRIFIGDITGGDPACVSEVRDQIQQLDPNKTHDVQVTVTRVDVADVASVDRWIQSIVNETGGLDLAANIAGLAQSAYSRPSPTILQEENGEWKRILDVNLTGVFNCTKAEICAMIPAPGDYAPESKLGNGPACPVGRRCSIVNMASLTACTPLADIYAYGSSKAAVAHFTSSVAKDVWKHGIRVNAVSPAATDTPMMPVFLPESTSGVVATNLELLSADDVADVIVWLLSDEAKLISGVNLPIGLR